MSLYYAEAATTLLSKLRNEKVPSGGFSNIISRPASESKPHRGSTSSFNRGDSQPWLALTPDLPNQTDLSRYVLRSGVR
jgi:hypothetical protein